MPGKEWGGGKAFNAPSLSHLARKASGSYYTPAHLVEALLDSALEPLLERAMQAENPESALLDLKICDPACGNGHFLLAAGRRLAARLAGYRSGGKPSETDRRRALAEALEHCLYGMDINPEALGSCLSALRQESGACGRESLQRHFICANSLLGAKARAMEKSFSGMAEAEELKSALHRLAGPLFTDKIKRPDPPASLAEIRMGEKAFRQWQSSPQWEKCKFIYDWWTAIFLRNRGGGEAAERNIRLEDLARYILSGSCPGNARTQVFAAANAYGFFHCELMFPEVAAKGGFDAMLGNPPWEHDEIREKEWFLAHGREDIAALPGKKRKIAISALEKDAPQTYSRFADDRERRKAKRYFYAKSGLYPLCGGGRANLYALFAEWMRRHLNETGRMGCVLPSGIATDYTTRFFFREMVESGSLISLYDFENRGNFPGVHSAYKLCLLTAGSGVAKIAEQGRFMFFANSLEDLDREEKCFRLSAADISLLNPETRSCPVFRCKKDAELTKAVYRRLPILGKQGENCWNIEFRQGLFNMTNDSHIFRERGQLEKDGWRLEGNVFHKEGKKYLPLYEAKMTGLCNHRAADVVKSRTALARQAQALELRVESLENPGRLAMPFFWVPEEACRARSAPWKRDWFLGFASVSSPTNARTLIPAIIPFAGAGNSFAILLGGEKAGLYPFLCANLSSFIFDYIVRQKIGGMNLNFYLMRQLPVLPPAAYDVPAPWQPDISLAQWLRPRMLELIHTAEDTRKFADDMGHEGAPFAWRGARRAEIMAEIDAAFFHLCLPADRNGKWRKCDRENDAEYRVLESAFPGPRHALEHIMDSFPIIREKETRAHGEFKTKKMILENYGRMGSAMFSANAH